MAFPAPTVVGSITQTASGASLVIPNTTAPAVGDFLVAMIGAYAGGSSRSLGATPSGWTLRSNISGDEEVCAIYTKVADSSDVSASDFTFSISSTSDVFSGAVIKVANKATGQEVAGSEVDSEADGSGSGFSFTTNLTPTTVESIIIAHFQGADNTNISAPTISSYASTPSLTWIELSDLGGKNGSQTLSFGIAYAQISGLTNITNRSATASGGANDGKDSLAIIVNGYTDASGTAALHVADADFFDPTATSDTNGTATLHTADADLFSTSGNVKQPAIWSNQSKNNSTWTPQDKP